MAGLTATARRESSLTDILYAHAELDSVVRLTFSHVSHVTNCLFIFKLLMCRCNAFLAHSNAIVDFAIVPFCEKDMSSSRNLRVHALNVWGGEDLAKIQPRSITFQGAKFCLHYCPFGGICESISLTQHHRCVRVPDGPLVRFAIVDVLV